MEITINENYAELLTLHEQLKSIDTKHFTDLLLTYFSSDEFHEQVRRTEIAENLIQLQILIEKMRQI